MADDESGTTMRRAALAPGAGPVPPDGRSRVGRVLALGGLLAAVAFVGCYVVFVRTGAGQRYDATLFARLQELPFGGVAGVIRTTVPLVLAAVALGCLVAMLSRGRWLDVTAAGATVVLSVGLAELLKASLGRPYLGENAYDYNTFPSVHMATTTALAIALVVLWPWAGTRRHAVVGVALLAALGALYNVVGFAHRPSDVVGGMLLAVACACSVGAVAAPGRRAA